MIIVQNKIQIKYKFFDKLTPTHLYLIPCLASMYFYRKNSHKCKKIDFVKTYNFIKSCLILVTKFPCRQVGGTSIVNYN